MLPRAASLFERLPRPLRRHRLMRAWMRFTGESPLQLVRIRDASLGYADLRNGFLRLIVIEQDFERDFFRLADRLLERGGVFVDVGANHGLLSFGLAGRHGRLVRFHLFEPNPELLPSIRRTLELYPQMDCTLNTTALGDHTGTASFVVESGHSGMSRIDPAGGIQVRLSMLDDYLEEQQCPPVDLLKIDVEGHELRVLRGSRRSLEHRRIHAVYLEYCEKWLSRVQPPRELIDYLEGAGYRVCLCRAADLSRAGGPTHAIRAGLPGEGLPLRPVAGATLPSSTDLLAIPVERLRPLEAAAG